MSDNPLIYSQKLICKKCGMEMEYDEGEGNYADGYICYECLGKMLDEMIDNEIEERKIKNSSFNGV